MPKITFFPDHKRIEVRKGENLLRAAMMAEVHINAPCGGEGSCGKCKVIVDKGRVKSKPTAALTKEEEKEGYRLACHSLVETDLEVRIPVESRLGKIPKKKTEPICGHVLSAKEWEERLKLKVSPSFKRVYLELKPPTLDDSISDLRRLRRQLKKICGLGEVDVDVLVLKKLPQVMRKGNFKVTVTLLDTELELKIVNVEAGDTTKRHFAIAVDVGTTTVVAQLLDLNKGMTLGISSDYNAQASAGADVISRIIFSTKENGLAKLQSMVIKNINGLIGDLIKQSGVRKKEICGIFAAGNTTMLHLLLGLDPRHIREEPYIPVATDFPWLKVQEVGIDLSETAYIFVFPCVASYIGGDIVSGVLASGLTASDKLTLYIDIGTNGEIVLGNREWQVACSCSAGPAFEGGGVKDGMRAVPGAVEQVRVDQDTYEPMILTVGGAKPIGICGSGLLDLLAELFLSGVVDNRGKINLDLPTKRIRKTASGPEYVLVWAKDSGNKKDIVLNEVDMDNLIRAKAATFAGIRVLMESTGTSFDDIDEVLIAGAFGNYLEVERVVAVGLLPELDCNKFKFVGNGSLLGAHLVALSNEAERASRFLAKKITYFDLSTNNHFMDEYVSALFLPHTDIESFPKVKELLEERKTS